MELSHSKPRNLKNYTYIKYRLGKIMAIEEDTTVLKQDESYKK
jgi:hypothetical protein